MKAKSTAKPGVVVAEFIILLQSLLLLAFGLAAWQASDTVIAGMDALTSADTAAAFITDDALVTESGSIGTREAQAIIGNFELVCLTALIIGLAVGTASLVRLLRRRR